MMMRVMERIRNKKKRVTCHYLQGFSLRRKIGSPNPDQTGVVPADETHAHDIVLPPPCFTEELAFSSLGNVTLI